ncbi:uncharacterized protein LOC135389664 [Ornithodoros turicata]|uniref:uncharacterized protein LOC135389664 n=1 Tax=Ornithodoros turicata TaxID=34597 RepID=UPI00313A39D0
MSVSPEDGASSETLIAILMGFTFTVHGSTKEETRKKWLANLQRKDFDPKSSARAPKHKGRRRVTRAKDTYTSARECSTGQREESATTHHQLLNRYDCSEGFTTVNHSLMYSCEPSQEVEEPTAQTVAECHITIAARIFSTTCDKSVQWEAEATDHHYARPSITDGKKTFDALIQAISPLAEVPFTLPIKDQILLTLMRLRKGLLLGDLALRFSITTAVAGRIFMFWMAVLATFSREFLAMWLPQQTIFASRPGHFKDSSMVTCIIDCFEVFIERPSNMRRRAGTYSHYKPHNTAKVLHVIAPNGFIMFVSQAYGGRASDRMITMDSGFLDHLLPGDEVLADRGFTVQGVMPYGVELSLPDFKRGKDQLSKEAVLRSRRLSKLRIHVERSIRRMKCFRILMHVPAEIFANSESFGDILIVVAGLCNLQPLLIRD